MMALFRISKYLYPILVIYLLCGCSSETDKQKTLSQNEFSTDVRVDSLFLGYHFGMTVRDFHSTSLEMNRRGEITGYTKVIYRMESLDYPALMEFYPTFIDNVITRIPVTIKYEGWAPWNEHLIAPQLIKNLKKYYHEVYDAEFSSKFVPEINRDAYVNRQANREIRIYDTSHSDVMVDFIDLSVDQ